MAGRDVMLAFPHAGTVRTEFMVRVLSIVHSDDSRVGEVADLATGPGIGMARNTLTGRFLESDMEWLWFCDTDMVPSTETLPGLLKHADPQDRPVVGALCCVIHSDQVKASLYQAAKDPGDGGFAFTHVTEWPHDTMLRVDATGCGCLLIHRSVFGRITAAKPEEDRLWFAEMIIGNHQIGEDLAFCMRCAIAEIPVFVHTGYGVGHMKTVQIGEITPADPPAKDDTPETAEAPANVS